MTDDSNTIHRALGRIEGKQDLLLLNQEDLKAKYASQSERLRAVERKQNHFIGWGAGAIAVWGLLMAYLKVGL